MVSKRRYKKKPGPKKGKGVKKFIKNAGKSIGKAVNYAKKNKILSTALTAGALLGYDTSKPALIAKSLGLGRRRAMRGGCYGMQGGCKF